MNQTDLFLEVFDSLNEGSSLIPKFDALVKSNGKFIRKYEKQLKDLEFKPFEVNGYKYTISKDVLSKFNKELKNSSLLKDMMKNPEKYGYQLIPEGKEYDYVRRCKETLQIYSKCFGLSESFIKSNSDYDIFFSYYRNNYMRKTDITVDKKKIDEAIDFLKNSHEILHTIIKDYQNCKKELDYLQYKAKDADTNYTRNNKDFAKINAGFIKLLYMIEYFDSDLLHNAYKEAVRAYDEASKFYKKICVSLL